MHFRPALALLAISVATLPTMATTSAATVQQTLLSFSGAKMTIDGVVTKQIAPEKPYGGLVADAAGSFYGTNSAGGPAGMGSIFRLDPPGPGQTGWTVTTLWTFSGADGGTPYDTLIMDSAGALYGTTSAGGTAGKGTVFKLSPPASGQTTWTETVLWSFKGGADGGYPYAGVIADASGALYGTSVNGGNVKACRKGCGVVFKLTPPAVGQTAWTESVLWTFAGGTDGANPYAGLVADPSGTLYGAASVNQSGYGSVFSLTPPVSGQTSWTEKTLLTFPWDDSLGATPYGTPIRDAAGNLYGTTFTGSLAGGSTVYMLSPPAAGKTQWTETTIGNLHGKSHAGLVADGTGAFYGTTKSTVVSGPGTVFKVTPPAAGQTAWQSSIVWTFKGGKGGATPMNGLIAGSAGTLYGTTSGGGVMNGGIIFTITP